MQNKYFKTKFRNWLPVFRQSSSEREMYLRNVTIALIFSFLFARFGQAFANQTNLQQNVLKRDKRFIIFDGGGTSKSVLGILVPVVTGDKKNWRSLNLGYNLQAQYTPLPSVIFPWSRFRRSLINQKENYLRNGTYTPDKTRLFMYNLIELVMNRRGIDGKECLLKSICEAAHSPIEKFSVFDEILHLLLTPNKNEVDSVYVDAMEAGNYGVDCSEMYRKCLPGHGILDNISYLKYN